MIFKRKRFDPSLIDHAPTGTIGGTSKNGWINSDLFFKYLQHFLKEVKCSPSNKVLLILDGHSTHTKSYRTIEFARDNDIAMLSILPHTSHKLQPLDRTFFKSLKSAYNMACCKWMGAHAGRKITTREIGELFCEAYMEKGASVVIAIKDFKVSGISPLDVDIIPEIDFAVERLSSSTAASGTTTSKAAAPAICENKHRQLPDPQQHQTQNRQEIGNQNQTPHQKQLPNHHQHLLSIYSPIQQHQHLLSQHHHLTKLRHHSLLNRHMILTNHLHEQML